MNHKALRKLLKSHGIGGMFESSRRIFDREFDETVTLEEMDSRIVTEVKKLKDMGLVQDKDASDCDSWVMWTIAGVTQQWALEHAGQGSTPQIRVGRAHAPSIGDRPGHDVVIGIVGENVYFWNYGVLTEYNPKIMDEVEFK